VATRQVFPLLRGVGQGAASGRIAFTQAHHTPNVAVEALCAKFHKPSPRKRTLTPR